jgi:hypothetical protein
MGLGTGKTAKGADSSRNRSNLVGVPSQEDRRSVDRPEIAYTEPDAGGAKNGERGTSSTRGCDFQQLRGRGQRLGTREVPSSRQISTGRNFDDCPSGQGPLTTGEIHGKPTSLACKLERRIWGEATFSRVESIA